MRRSNGEHVFNVFNITLLAILAVLTVYPFLYTLSISMSTAQEAARDGLHLVPGNPATLGQALADLVHLQFTDAYNDLIAYGKGISLEAYRMVLVNREIIVGYGNTLFRTIVGTILSLLATAMAAYPLSRRNMPFRKRAIFLIMFTMLFSGGLVPSYLLIKSLGLINSIWVYVIPGLISAFNILIMKNFFQSIPESLYESAVMDGANDFSILFRIYLPLSKPVLATIGLWTAVAHWNSWFDGLLYITDNDKQVLQVTLRRIVIENSTEMVEKGILNPNFMNFTPETIKAATVIVAILPILLIYPFAQKYFVKGTMLGSVKE
ncbi:MAG: carbohydrate ABC transporter permease [bacterium]